MYWTGGGGIGIGEKEAGGAELVGDVPTALTGIKTAPEGATTGTEVAGEAVEGAAGVGGLYADGGGVVLRMRADGLVICKNRNECLECLSQGVAGVCSPIDRTLFSHLG